MMKALSENIAMSSKSTILYLLTFFFLEITCSFGSSPFVLYSSTSSNYWNPSKVFKIPINNHGLSSSQPKRVNSPHFTPRAIAYDPKSQRMFYDYGWEIHSVKLDGTGDKFFVGNLGKVIDLAVDIEGRNLYWVHRQRIEVARIDGSFRKTLFGVSNPTSLVLDLKNREIYWSSYKGYILKIERASMDGTNRTVLFTGDHSMKPTGIAIDTKNRVLAWAEKGKSQISYIDITIPDAIHSTIKTPGHTPFRLAFIGQRIYWVDYGDWWTKGKVGSLNTTSKSDVRTLVRNVLDPKEIFAYDPSEQICGNTRCGTNRGGCEHLCLQSPVGDKCVCTNGTVLSGNGKNCHMRSFLLAADDMRRKIFYKSFDDFNQRRRALPLGQTGYVNTVDFDPFDKKIYWTDDKGKITRAFLDGGAKEKVINSTSGHSPSGHAIDVIGRNLYWFDAVHNRIGVSKLDGRYPKTLVKLSQVPVSIAIASKQGYIYWSHFSGRKITIKRSQMNGTSQEDVVTNWRSRFKVYAVFLAFDEETNRLFFHDEHRISYKDTSNLNSAIHSLYSLILSYPSGLAVKDSYIYWGDLHDERVYRLNKTSFMRITYVATIVEPVDLHVYHNYSGTVDDFHPCAQNNGWCTHLCLINPNGYSCSCPTNTGSRKCYTTPVMPSVSRSMPVPSSTMMYVSSTVTLMSSPTILTPMSTSILSVPSAKSSSLVFTASSLQRSTLSRHAVTPSPSSSTSSRIVQSSPALTSSMKTKGRSSLVSIATKTASSSHLITLVTTSSKIGATSTKTVAKTTTTGTSRTTSATMTTGATKTTGATSTVPTKSIASPVTSATSATVTMTTGATKTTAGTTRIATSATSIQRSNLTTRKTSERLKSSFTSIAEGTSTTEATAATSTTNRRTTLFISATTTKVSSSKTLQTSSSLHTMISPTASLVPFTKTPLTTPKPTLPYKPTTTPTIIATTESNQPSPTSKTTCPAGYYGNTCNTFIGDNKIKLTIRKNGLSLSERQFKNAIADGITKYCKKGPCYDILRDSKRIKRDTNKEKVLVFSSSDVLILSDPVTFLIEIDPIKIQMAILDPLSEATSVIERRILCKLVSNAQKMIVDMLDGPEIIDLNRECNVLGGGANAGKQTDVSVISSSVTVSLAVIVAVLFIAVLTFFVVRYLRKRTKENRQQTSRRPQEFSFQNDGYLQDDVAYDTPTFTTTNQNLDFKKPTNGQLRVDIPNDNPLYPDHDPDDDYDHLQVTAAYTSGQDVIGRPFGYGRLNPATMTNHTYEGLIPRGRMGPTSEYAEVGIVSIGNPIYAPGARLPSELLSTNNPLYEFSSGPRSDYDNIDVGSTTHDVPAEPNRSSRTYDNILHATPSKSNKRYENDQMYNAGSPAHVNATPILAQSTVTEDHVYDHLVKYHEKPIDNDLKPVPPGYDHLKRDRPKRPKEGNHVLHIDDHLDKYQDNDLKQVPPGYDHLKRDRPKRPKEYKERPIDNNDWKPVPPGYDHLKNDRPKEGNPVLHIDGANDKEETVI